ncbi:MAG: 3-deoxy-D-arabino-heptulosonate 7-phosphate synthase [Leptospiraceae bacterium]|nr:3-deoxy-D-arabino-heptulosonate 7-phosphate synthase [Leptospiraceae bacterium]
MIIPHGSKLNAEQIYEIRSILAEFGCELDEIVGATRSIYAIKGDERHQLMINRLEGLAYVARVDTIQSPYKLMDRQSELARQSFEIGGRVLKQELLLIAGHCTIDPDNPQLFLETAQAVQEAGAHVLRGGIWKPRTSPHSYQGDVRALQTILDARAETGLPINIEVMDHEQLALAMEAGVDMIQVGARNALNYSLLKSIGEKTASRQTFVLLKRGLHMGPIKEFISAAEYIVAAGNSHVLLCPRGTAPAMDGYRNHPDECITPLLQQQTWAPVIVDPSHSVGRAVYVPHAALAAVAYGADGLVIECHIQPNRGIGDDPKQAVTPACLARIYQDALPLFEASRQYRAYLD